MEYLRLLQTAAFLVLGVFGALLWWRHRSRPARYLALAFGMLVAGLILSRVMPDLTGRPGEFRSAAILLVLLGFPWLLAAMAWSFEGPLPGWLRRSALPAAAYAALPLVAPVHPVTAEPTSIWQSSFVFVYLAVWTLFAGSASFRLLRTSQREGLVRERMRLMAVGLAVLNLALLIAGADVGGRPGVTAVTTVLSLIAAAAFIVGFAPPLLLRVWWRRRSAEQFQRMQEALIGAATPEDVASAVAPMLAELVGGGVAVIARDGVIQAAAHLDDEQLREDRSRLLSRERLRGEAQVIEVDAYWLVVRTDPYTPVFGQGELEIVDGLSLQLRLALERAELFQAHLEARAAAEAASSELEATLMGLSHDLKSPTAAVAGFAQLLGRAASSEERSHLVEQIQASAVYLEDLVDALLEYSKVGRTQVAVEPVALSLTVDSVVRRLAATHPGLTVVGHDDLPVLLVNPVRAEQLFDNLLGNAVKHGGRPDITVAIRAEEDDEGGVRLRIQDDGVGLGDGDAERIFTLFARGRGATRSGSGVGLGLVRRIVESYGGTVGAPPSERGAEFELTFPPELLVETAAAERADDRGPVAGRRTTK